MNEVRPVAPSRQQLSQREIDEVMRRYRVGTINAIHELPEGSVYSPKVILETQRGTLLLKRRARGLDLPALVAFGHEVVLGCLHAGLCVPPLIATRDEANSMVQHNDHIYELFVYISGDRFNPGNLQHASQMGSLLHETHGIMDTLRTEFEPARESDTIDVDRLARLTPYADALEGGLVERFSRIVRHGQELAQANASVPALVHGDWHPGNMIFKTDTLVAVCDFDNTRVGSRDRERAQAMVHASLITPQPGQPGGAVPPEPDKARLGAFWSGFAGAGGRANARTLAGLMPAVMIDEALASLGDTPSDAGAGLLVAIDRKSGWMDANQQLLIELLRA